MGEIGSVKNRFKAWFRALKINKNRLNKTNGYKIKRAFVFLIFPFLIIINNLFSGKKNNKTKTISKPLKLNDKTIVSLDKKINYITKQVKKTTDIEVISTYKEIIENKKQIINEMDANYTKSELLKEKIFSLKNKISDIEQMINNSESKNNKRKENSVYKSSDISNKNYAEKVKINNTINQNYTDKAKTNNVSKKLINNTLTKEQYTTGNCENQNQILEKSEDKTKEKDIVKTTRKGKNIKYKEKYIKYIKDTNKEITELKKQINDIKERTKKEENINNLLSIEYELVFVKNKIKDLKEKYFNVKSIKEFDLIKQDEQLLEKDINFITKGIVFKNLDILYKECIDDIERSKKKIVINRNVQETRRKEIIKQHEKKLQEAKKNDRKIKEDRMFEIKLFDDTVKKNIEENEIEIIMIKRQMKLLNNKFNKKCLLGSVKKLVSKSLNIAFGLSPFLIFKNRCLNHLLSSVILNNTIRGMNNLFYNEENMLKYLTFKDVSSIFYDEISYINKTKDIYIDSLEKIANLKNEIYNIYLEDNEMRLIVSQINKLEYQLTDKINELEKIEVSIDMEYNKAKQKVKRMEV